MKQIRITDLPTEKLQERLRREDDYKRITFGEEERDFFIGGVTYDFADDEGVDFADVVETLEKLSKKAEKEPEGFSVPSAKEAQEQLNALTWFVYLGIKPFEPDLSPAEVKLDISALGEEGMVALMKSIAPEVEEDRSVGNGRGGSPPASPEGASANGATASVETTGAGSD